jgi:dihydrolipoamide dehydrogenase
MANSNHFDLIVIGGGPAGYVAAIRAAQLGKSVAVIERDKLGGVCLNWGCIPTKALIAGAELYQKLQHEGDSFGIGFDNLSYDWDKIIGRSRNVAGNLNQGVTGLLKKNKIQHFAGHAFIPEAGKVQVFDHKDVEASLDPNRPGVDQDMPAEVRFTREPKEQLTADKLLIATGAAPRPLPGAPFDGEKIISSKEAMTLPQRPDKLLIVGSGAIGMEFAYFYNAFGTQVTVVEMLDRVLPIEDREVSAAAEKAFKKQGVNLLTGHVTKSIETTDTGIKAVVAPAEDTEAPARHPAKKSYGAEGAARDQAGAEEQRNEAPDSATQTLEADAVLVAIGVRGRFDGLFDDALGVELSKGHIKVDYRRANPDYQTSVPGIYAVGDVIGPPWLAHVASEEAIAAVERMFGHEVPDIDYESIPGCTYCNPQVASIGYTEQRCQDEGIDYDTGKFPFMASGKAQAMGDTTGFVKLITRKPHGEILGAHMIGEGVTEMIAEMGLAIRLEATAEEVINTIHAHPTMSEAVHEAALGTDDRMIHF